MVDPDDAHRQRERQFVGTVCASLSHEIKNCLAIINENAGLMGDLALLAGQGRPVDPERHTRIAAAVQKQVRRADRLVGDLNRFAHSGDVDRRELALADTIAFVVTLFERTASKAGRQVRVAAAHDPEVKVETAPLGLLQLLWGILSVGIEGETGGDLRLSVVEGEGGALVRIDSSAPAAEAFHPPDALVDLARVLGGTLTATGHNGVELSLPLKRAATLGGGL
jgi:C4-dicarboxylate-specific signal transduction histidine kinase